MSAAGLGCAKTPAVAPHVEISPGNFSPEKSNHTAHARFDALLENCVFYILRMYEFLHRVGQKSVIRRCRLNVPVTPGSGHAADMPDRLVRAKTGREQSQQEIPATRSPRRRLRAGRRKSWADCSRDVAVGHQLELEPGRHSSRKDGVLRNWSEEWTSLAGISC
jgi:hypothetical protein